VLLQYFGDHFQGPCDNCDTCQDPIETWDGTLAARKALYLTRITEQRFGTQHLIDVLLGQSNPRTVRFGHDNLSAFGRGKELSDREWHSVFRQLIASGYLTVDLERYGSIKLTEKSAAVLEHRSQVLLRKDPPKKRKQSRMKPAAKAIGELSPVDGTLFEALKAKRREIAASHGVPPYVIFHDTTLKSIATRKPTTLTAFQEIPGVGERKLTSYGQIFIDVVSVFGNLPS
jgi:ATP-dependent DNA helicase RecQ